MPCFRSFFIFTFLHLMLLKSSLHPLSHAGKTGFLSPSPRSLPDNYISMSLPHLCLKKYLYLCSLLHNNYLSNCDSSSKSDKVAFPGFRVLPKLLPAPCHNFTSPKLPGYSLGQQGSQAALTGTAPFSEERKTSEVAFV